MPHPSHRIDLLLVPSDPERRIGASEFEALCQQWSGRGWIKKDGPGPVGDALISGDFARVWLDHPGRVVLYANQQGGFRVMCPDTGTSIAKAFGLAMRQWRAGGTRTVDCPACMRTHPLDACHLSPVGAFGSSAIVFSDAGGIELTEQGKADVRAAIGPFHEVVRRPL